MFPWFRDFLERLARSAIEKEPSPVRPGRVCSDGGWAYRPRADVDVAGALLEAAGASALEHILGDRATMPAAAGVLLDQTWRMHPDLCWYTSATLYDGKPHGVDGLGRQEILGWASGLRLVEVPHQGNTASPEEAREVARLAEQLTGRTWHGKNGTERSMDPPIPSSSRPTTRRSEPSSEH